MINLKFSAPVPLNNIFIDFLCNHCVFNERYNFNEEQVHDQLDDPGQLENK